MVAPNIDPPGIIDNDALERAMKLGINLKNGAINTKDGRVRLFTKKFPGVKSMRGSCLRSRIIWWLYTGEILSGFEFNLHHKNHNRADDRFSNLDKLTHVEHTREHNPKGLKMLECICKVCGYKFKIDGWRKKEKTRGTYCSQRCYHICPIRRKNHSKRLKLNARKIKCA